MHIFNRHDRTGEKDNTDYPNYFEFQVQVP